MKTCNKCQVEKTLNEFSTNGSRINSHCKSCRAKRYKDYYATDKEKNRLRERTLLKRKEAQEYVRLLKNNPCKDCGKILGYWNMQFDHLRDKEWTIGRLTGIGATKSKIDAEVEKCELVCVVCHGNRTQHRWAHSNSYRVRGALSVFNRPCFFEWCSEVDNGYGDAVE